MNSLEKDLLIIENERLRKEIELLKNSGSSSTAESDLQGITIAKIFENAGLGIVFLDYQRKISRANEAFQKLLEYSESELSQISIQEITHPQDYIIDHKLFEELVNEKRDKYTIEKRYISKTGNVVYARLTVSKISDNFKNNNECFLALIENITQFKLLAQKLSAEQSLFNAILEYHPDNIYFKDLESRFIKINGSMNRKLGFKNPDDVLGKTDFDIFTLEHSTQAYNDEQEIIRTGTGKVGIEERETWNDGKVTWGSTTKMPLRDLSRKIIGTFGITRDITESKLIHDKIAESEKLYRSLFENSADGMFLIDDVIIDCNQSACGILLHSREEIVGVTPADFSPEHQPDGSLSTESAAEKISESRNGKQQRFQWKHIRSDGALVDVEVSLNVVIIGGKKLVLATLRDITRKKKADSIREAVYTISEEAFAASDMNILYKKIHEAISLIMPANNFYISLYDEKAQTISFPYFVDIFDPPQQSKKIGNGLTEYILKTGQPCLIDAQKDLELRRNGDVDLIGAPQAIWLGVPLKISGKTIGVLVVQDYENEKAFGEDEMQLLMFVSEQIAQVIERKRKSAEIEKVTESLRQLNTTKDKFFSIIAHDLRNPFITILGFSEVLMSDYNELTDEEKLYYIEEMKKAAEVSHNLLQNLLQWSRSQTGKIDFHPAQLNLSAVSSEVLNLLEASAARKKIVLSSSIPIELLVFADEDMLNSILRNLISNAIKFTKRDGEIKISATYDDSFVEIHVKDNGIGMNEETRASLFRIDSTHSTFGTENEAGTGLGLILCKEFVEKNGGKITVESQPGEGTTFKFTLIKCN